MQHGDLSNELPKRVLVTTDSFSTVEPILKKKWKFIPSVSKELKIRKDLLSKFYLFTTVKGVILEVVSYDLDNEQLLTLMNTLDEMGTNPFRYSNAYDSLESLVSNLPFRPEVLGVIDVPSNILRYGHWGMDFNYL